MSALEEFLVEPFEPEPEREGVWRIDGIGTAEWVVAKLRRAKREIAAAQAEYDAWKARADEWLAHETSRWHHDVEWAEAQLIRWHRELREQDERENKTVALPSGARLVSRAGQRLPRVHDEAAFLAWAKEHEPALVRIKESPDLKALSAALKATGEVPPGVAVEETETTFRVEVELP